MIRRSGTARVAIALLWAIAASARAETSIGEPDWKPRDSIERLVLGVAVFREAEIDGALRGGNLGRIVAQLLAERLAPIDEHVFGRGEALALVARQWRDFIDEKLVQLDGMLAERDLLAARARVVEADAKTAEAQALRRRVALAQALELSDEGLAESKAVGLAPEHQRFEPLPVVVGDPREYARRHNLHFLVHGRVERAFEGFVVIDLEVYNDIARRVVHRDTAAGSEDRLSELVADLADRAAASILGRPWGVLDIVTEADARIYLDGNLAGIGSLFRRYVRPGARRILVRPPGLPAREHLVLVGPHETGEAFLDYERPEPRRVKITSDPPAVVYLGSERMSVTPLDLPATPLPSLAALEAEGHKRRIFVHPPAADRVEAKLRLDLLPWERRLRTKRDAFYWSFGWFILSLPIPVLVYGWYENVALGVNKLIDETGPAASRDFNRLVQTGNILYYAYYGSLFLSGSLLVDAVARLFEYLDVVEESRYNPD